MTMQTEVIVPLIGYLLLVFLLSAYAYRKRDICSPNLTRVKNEWEDCTGK